jgi:hypothetical protein
MEQTPWTTRLFAPFPNPHSNLGGWIAYPFLESQVHC